MAYSRYGSSGKGLSDRGTRRYAARVARKHGTASKQYQEATTFVSPTTGKRTARGTFQVMGLTAASLGLGTGMTGYRVTGDTGLTAYEFAAKYQQVGTTVAGEKLYHQRTTPGVPKAPAARGMVGEQTTQYAGAPSKGYGKASMGGMRKGDWKRPQKPKEDTKGKVAGVGTVVAVGGIGYLIWSLFK